MFNAWVFIAKNMAAGGTGGTIVGYSRPGETIGPLNPNPDAEMSPSNGTTLGY